MSSDEAAVRISPEEFVQNLSDSGLFGPEDVRTAVEAVPSATTVPDGRVLAGHLVGLGKLTPYQADAVLQRRFEDLRIGNYEVLARLGQGGMGTVFKARHRRMKRVVALKVLAREAAGHGSFAQRFQREVETLAQLNHPNIVMAFDADESEIGCFLVMEFVNGRDLASEVQHGGPLSVADAVHCILQAARGLAYAHAQGIIHRDVKPANLLRDAAGLVKVADLGLARLSSPGDDPTASSSLTLAGGIVGTTDFMPPEQALDSTTIDHRADVYSLGCTLYFLLTGRPPYAARSLMALMLAHREAPIPSLCAARPEVPAELDAVFRRMAAKKPEDRDQTMAEVVAALEGVAGRAAMPDARPAPRPEPAPTAGLSEVTVAADSLDQLVVQGARPTMTDLGAAPTPSEARRVADLTVILVEPSRTQAGIIRRFFQQLGIEKIHTTGSGKEAIEQAGRLHANVVLSSMHLSDMTGVELAGALPAACPGVGFVLASSASDTGDAAAAQVSPGTVLLPKPFDLRQLARSLAEATGRAPEDILPPQS
jgi:serine/threonine-protein kinase